LGYKDPVKNCVLDWALVEVKDAAGPMSNVRPPLRFIFPPYFLLLALLESCSPRGELVERIDPANEAFQVPPQSAIDYLESIGFESFRAQHSATDLVFKTGAATGTTVGIRCPARVNVCEEFETPDGGTLAIASEECAVVSLGQATAPFARPGDSGALVFDKWAGQVGMLWGCLASRGKMQVEGEEIEYDKLCLVTPMVELVRSMQERLRASMGVDCGLTPL
jgi:hypothetical protein